MINVILYIAGMAILLYAAIIYGSQALVLFAFCGAGYAVLAGLFLAYRRTKITAELKVPVAAADKGKMITVEIHTKNCGKLPVWKIYGRISWKNYLDGKKKRYWLKGCAPAQGTSILRAKCRAQTAGSGMLGLDYVRIYDLTGLFYARKKVCQEVIVQTLPELLPMHITVGQATRHFAGEADAYDDARGGNDPSEVFQIREFRAGDKIQSIHWKLSAKTEELMVKENSLPLGGAVVILADAAGLAGKSAECAETFLRLAYAMSVHLIEEKCVHYIAWECGKEGEIRRIRVENEEGAYRFLMEFFATASFAKKAHGSLRERYREKYKAQPYVTDVRINAALDIFVNENLAGRISAKKPEEACAGLELFV